MGQTGQVWINRLRAEADQAAHHLQQRMRDEVQQVRLPPVCAGEQFLVRWK